MTYLDSEIGKYIYTKEITKFQILNEEEFDFLLDIDKKDNIKFDVINPRSDLSDYSYDSIY